MVQVLSRKMCVKIRGGIESWAVGSKLAPLKGVEEVGSYAARTLLWLSKCRVVTPNRHIDLETPSSV
jgi:hypothetical protein